MTLVSLTDCCHLLAIDPKTLRRWMSLSHLEALAHPTDARIKCVTSDMIQQLAATHHRTLLNEKGTDLPKNQEAPVAPTAVRGPLWPSGAPDLPLFISSLLNQLGSSLAQVATLQHQLALLTDQWQKEQQWPTSQASMAEEKSLDSSQEKSLDSSQEKSLQSSQEKSLDSSQEKSLRSPKEKAVTASVTDRRSRHHVLPLVEYCSEARYVVICPERGLLDFSPDSASWFAWLSTLSSFHFVGASGHLTVHRNGCSPRWTWRATRSIHSRSRSLHLVRTEFLTVAVLEQAAASLQSLLN